MSEQKIIGIDLAKTNFYLFSINAHGKPAGKSKLSRNQLLNCKRRLSTVWQILKFLRE
ncbi:TPA: hypothetical protein KJG05_002147 [Escherichia coli]|nr:hypothetical protein [Escherichia coli]